MRLTNQQILECQTIGKRVEALFKEALSQYINGFSSIDFKLNGLYNIFY